MPNQNINTSPNPVPTKPKSPVAPPPPNMFSGRQGFFLILVLVAAVAGWVLYLNKLELMPHKESAENPDTMENEAMEETSETVPYAEIPKTYVGDAIELPAPKLSGSVSLEEALASRRSRRDFMETPISQSQLSQVLWAAQGITNEQFGGRTAPSAHSLYPVNLYVVVRNVENLAPGLYQFLPADQAIRPLVFADNLLAGESQQPSVKSAPAVLVYGAVFDKAREFFEPDSAKQVTLQESGHIAQNVYLEAEATDMATVTVGGFDPDQVKNELKLASDETIVYLQPLGNRTEEATE